MKVGERWEITGRKSDFTVVEIGEGKNPKTGEPTITRAFSYHPTLEQCLNKILNKSLANEIEHQDLEGLIALINTTKQELKEAAHATEMAFQGDSETPLQTD